MRYESKRLLKDITRLGRDIRRVVIVDNTPDNFRNCLANGVTIDSWIGDKDDLALSNLLPILVTAAEQKVEDVRDFFKCQKLTLTHIS
jgi:CTD small phosphatase-like protein 2